MAEIENHSDWLARDLPEDFGLDGEAELSAPQVRGEILKLQIKTSQKVIKRRGQVKLEIDRKYLDYASSCRYPVILVRVDLSAKQAWYLWLQQWILAERSKGNYLDTTQDSLTTWIDESQTLRSGLDSDLKDVARWRGKTQLVLSLLDAMRAAATTGETKLVEQVVALLSEAAPILAGAAFDIILREAVLLGDRLRGTAEGVETANQLFAFVRKFGEQMTVATIDAMVRRNDAYSRTGLVGLAILYDDHPGHLLTLDLVNHFLKQDLMGVAYYCALRQANPGKPDCHFIGGAGDFVFAGLKFDCPLADRFWDKYANRGPSAILDYLVPVGAKS
jgi:hypothetical protein